MKPKTFKLVWDCLALRRRTPPAFSTPYGVFLQFRDPFCFWWSADAALCHVSGRTRTSTWRPALLTDFFSFQLAAVFWASVGFFLHHAQLIRLGNGVWLCFAFGAVLNLLVVVALCGAVFSPRALPTLWGWLMRPARRLFPQRAEGWRRWGEKQWKDLRQCTRCYRTHKRQLGKMFLTSLVQLAAYHSVPFWVYLAFGLQGQSFWAMVGLQGVLFLSVSSLPLPGAVGLTEGGFLLLYQTIFPGALLPSAMLLSRTVSFYFFLLLSGLFLAFRFLRLAWRHPAAKTT